MPSIVTASSRRPTAPPRGSQGEHGFDGEGRSEFEAGGEATFVVVRDLQIGVELGADTVTDELTHDTEPMLWAWFSMPSRSR